jgi:hypothetical protein
MEIIAISTTSLHAINELFIRVEKKPRTIIMDKKQINIEEMDDQFVLFASRALMTKLAAADVF